MTFIYFYLHIYFFFARFASKLCTLLRYDGAVSLAPVTGGGHLACAGPRAAVTMSHARV